MQRDRSIRSQLIRLILMISSLGLLAALAIFFSYEIISYQQSTARELRVIGGMLAQNTTAALAFNDVQEGEELLSSLHAEPGIVSAALYDQYNKLFADVQFHSEEGNVPEKPLRNGLMTSTDFYELVVPVAQGQKKVGTLYIKRSTQDIYERLLLYLLIVFAVVVICFSVTYILSSRLGRSISDPIVALAAIAKVVSEKDDYSVRVSSTGEGEIRTLTTSFNDMLSRIHIQNREIQQHRQQLELKVEKRTVELKRQKEFAETVINSSLVLIAVFDTETRFIAFNKRCETEFGVKKEDVLGKPYAEAMPNVVGSVTYKAVLQALNGEVVHNERYKSTVSGEYYESFSIPLRNEMNEVYAALLTAHNITEIVNASEKLIVSNEELRKKNIELEQFAYVASHDLQEPLRKIRMFSDLAKRTFLADMQVTKYLDKIDVSAERMSRLIKNVLEYSKISKVEDSFIETDLNIILEYVKSDFELVITDKDAVIERSQLPVVRGHQLQLHQLFANLISNAIKFSEKSPHVRIYHETAQKSELEHIKMPEGRERYHKIVFEDNGIGFDPQFKDQIFTLFQRLNTRDQYEGTGIGLALCKKIVDNHNGHITVDSAVGRGSRFHIFLPAS